MGTDMWPEFLAIVEAGKRAPGLHETDLASARASMDRALIRWAGDAPPGCTRRNVIVPTDHRDVAARVYTPDSDVGSLRPLIVVFHGGGFVMGSLDSQDALAHRIALESDSVVVSVDYSLAPEHPFPEGVNDSIAVYEWIHQNGDALGADPTRLGVWGESAGASVAAAVALMARDRQVAPAAQFLAYPALCSTLETKAWDTLGTDYWLTRETMAWFWQQYLQGTQQCSSAYAEPLHAESLIGMPRTILVTAGLDPLRDEGAAYARRLRDAGTEVTFDCVEGAIHGFLSMSSISPRANSLLSHYITAFGDLLHPIEHAGSEDSPRSRSDLITRNAP